VPENRLAHQVVAGRYELLERVGRGGFGVVWRACDTLLQRHVALKEIHIPGFLDDGDRAELREKVLKEARAAARLDHPGAVTVFDVLDDDDQPVIVMELVEAPDLSELVSLHGPLPPAEAARIGLEVLDVLAAAHSRGIVHRDVKPGNVLVGPGDRVRLGDFGVAAILDDPTVSTSGAVTGSPAYMAPEQATNKGAVPESDLWSLGATLYFAVEGRPPFDKGAPLPTLTSIVHDPPRPAEHAGALGPVLDGLLVKDPQARLESGPLRDRLAQVMTAASPAPAVTRSDDTAVLQMDDVVVPPPPPPVAEAPPPRPPPAPVPGRRSQSRLPWVFAVVALLVVALIGIGLASNDGSRQQGNTGGGSAATTTTPGSSASTSRSSGGRAASTSDWIRYTDPQTGFTISHPPAWTVRINGTLTDFRDPETGAYLRVDHVQPPKPSPEAAWQELEPRFAAENTNYRRIRIEPTTYAGSKAALWEFTYTSGGAELHVGDLGFITPSYGFALYFQTRAGDWDGLQPVFQAFKESFKAPA
jgi:serine/threonine protein kinase